MNQKKPLIRKAKTADLKTLQKLGTKLMESLQQLNSDIVVNWYLSSEGEKYYLSKIRGNKAICLVAELDNEIVGYLTGEISPIQTWRPLKRAELANLYVKEKARSHGIGTLLVNAFVHWSKVKDVERIFLHTHALQEDAQQFYKKQGLTERLIEMEKEI